MRRLFARLFRRWLATLDHFDVGDGRGDTFFRRHDVLKTRWGALYLHEFFRSDNDRCLHDHPWAFWTLILRGGYWEIVQPFPAKYPGMQSRLWRRPGRLLRYPATHAHRIEIDPAKPRPWSLVWVGRKVRPWGFWGPDGWRPWRKGEPNPVCEMPEGKAVPA